MSTALAVLEPREIDITDKALSIDKLLAQRRLITEAMNQVMKEGLHYGKVQGCGDKPTLLQPGAQLLAHLFRLRPEYEIFETDILGSHKRYRITCRHYVMGIDPPLMVAEGVGEASSMESKYRYRNAAAEVEDTGKSVPSRYWDIRKKDGDEAARKFLAETHGLDPEGLGTKKINGDWHAVYYRGGEEKVENPNPADVHNTVLKIAKKRAYVDATITATASNDFFTQDLEDIRENLAAAQAEAASHTEGGDAPIGSINEKPATGRTVEPEDAGDKVTRWEDVEIHFGKNKGRRLGDLNDKTLNWYADFMAKPSDRARSKEDKMLIAALTAARASRGGAEDDEIPGLEASGDTRATDENSPRCGGPEAEKLLGLMNFNTPEITVAQVLDTLKKQGLIEKKADTFAAVTEPLAKRINENFEAFVAEIAN